MLDTTAHTLGEWSEEEIEAGKPEKGKRCTNPNFARLGQKTDGYSGSDISALVREALLEPLRFCQRSKYFRCDKHGNWRPCNEEDTSAEEMTIDDVPKNRLAQLPVTYSDFTSALERCHASVSQAELKQYEEWTWEEGADGKSKADTGDKKMVGGNGDDDGFAVDFSAGFTTISGIMVAPDCDMLQDALTGVELYEGKPQYSKQVINMTVFASTSFAKQKNFRGRR
jgi:hypothetical protein